MQLGNFIDVFTFWDNPSVPSWRNVFTLVDGTDRLSRNVGKKRPSYAAQNLKRAQISFKSQRMPEIVVYLQFSSLDISNEIVHALG